MMEKIKNISRILALVLLTIGFLVVARPFLVPFLYGLLIALIIYPICKRLENRKIPRGAAVLVSVGMMVILFAGVLFVLILEVNALNNELPVLIQEANLALEKGQNWIVTHLGISLLEQKKMFIDAGNSFGSNLGGFISGTAAGLLNLVLIPVYAALILFYRNMIVNFIVSVAGQKYKEELPEILGEAIHTYFKYIKGMFFVYLSVGVLNSIGLWLLGVKYPLLFGMLTAFMTIIPYFGIIISSLLPISIAWLETQDIYVPLGIVAVFSFVQYLEAYFIFPYIVGKQLNINTLASLVLIIIGGLIWGVAGMLLFLPYVALLKIVSGKIEGLEPLRALLEIPPKKR